MGKSIQATLPAGGCEVKRRPKGGFPRDVLAVFVLFEPPQYCRRCARPA